MQQFQGLFMYLKAYFYTFKKLHFKISARLVFRGVFLYSVSLGAVMLCSV